VRSSIVADDSPPLLALQLFGPFEARVNGDPLPQLRFRKGEWLLALLTLRAGRLVERDWLAGLLWPERTETPALTSLRNSLLHLRQALGPAACRLEAPTGHTLRLELLTAEADVLAFDAAVARGDGSSLEQAVALYRGPLLEGCSEPWAFEERQIREEAYLSALERRASQATAQGDLETAERHLRRAVSVEPLRETAQRADAGAGDPGKLRRRPVGLPGAAPAASPGGERRAGRGNNGAVPTDPGRGAE
jgi:DNA-binding SARP family transcriptional activator